MGIWKKGENKIEDITWRPRPCDPEIATQARVLVLLILTHCFTWFTFIKLSDNWSVDKPIETRQFCHWYMFSKLKNFWISEKHRIVSSILHPKFKKQYHMKRKYSEKGLGKFENALRGILLFGNSRKNCFIYRLKFPQNQTNIILGFKETWSTVDQGSLAAQEFDVSANSSDLWSFLIIHFYT